MVWRKRGLTKRLRRFDPGEGDPWAYPRPLNLSFAHFKDHPKCPICGFGPEAHIYYREIKGIPGVKTQKWGCPHEHETPGEVLARLGSEVQDAGE